MKDINCPICSESNYNIICKKKYSTNEYSIVRCSSCLFYFTNPEPNEKELIEFYNNEYLDKHQLVWHKYENGFNLAMLKLINKYDIKNLLDLGSGQGGFVKLLKKNNINSTGVELVNESCLTAKEIYGIDLINKTCEEYIENCNTLYDCITILNVLEHLKDPMNIMKMTLRCLKRKAILIIVIPNVDFTIILGMIRSIFGFKDKYMLNSKIFSQQGFDPPIHLSAFNQRSIRMLLKHAGYKIISITNAPIIESNIMIISLIKYMVYFMGKVIELLTLNRIVWGYSLLIICKKE